VFHYCSIISQSGKFALYIHIMHNINFVVALLILQHHLIGQPSPLHSSFEINHHAAVAAAVAAATAAAEARAAAAVEAAEARAAIHQWVHIIDPDYTFNPSRPFPIDRLPEINQFLHNHANFYRNMPSSSAYFRQIVAQTAAGIEPIIAALSKRNKRYVRYCVNHPYVPASATAARKTCTVRGQEISTQKRAANLTRIRNATQQQQTANQFIRLFCPTRSGSVDNHPVNYLTIRALYAIYVIYAAAPSPLPQSPSTTAPMDTSSSSSSSSLASQ
jgi:hypothetical protein